MMLSFRCQSRASVVDLFVGFLDSWILGFLDCYATYFDYSTNFIQMVSKKLEYKPDRWCKYPMCIADPFKTDHNLEQGVVLQMFEFIRSCMEHSMEVFTDCRIRSDCHSRYELDVDEIDARV
ncbi:PAP-associated domain-containing protein [Caenorhabditis elegans]|uniref:PAP-associated domain-containing protein n=1 Tax=Caenorhabditis elegans TaxID=6239 RepID=Q9GR67_CAEEL|nr:PAP-associated domain-containing protein [Caenorhabditis elegans]CCD68897.1 PAP-associated domain-containing protein [Caenorhabditis elegans]|eukprot:NP_497314.1 Uncharacterized protein CELE_Y34F4.3 [Caenorhabditis elegans]